MLKKANLNNHDCAIYLTLLYTALSVFCASVKRRIKDFLAERCKEERVIACIHCSTTKKIGRCRFGKNSIIYIVDDTSHKTKFLTFQIIFFVICHICQIYHISYLSFQFV